MKRYFVAVILCVTMLSSCLETISETTINANGSGNLHFMMDMSEGMKLAAQGQKGEDLAIDTLIRIKDHSDTSSLLTAHQKELMRDMTIQVNIDMKDVEEMVFRFEIDAPFKNLKDFNELNELMKKSEYDKIFDKAIKIPLLDGDKKEDKEESSENDNIFGSVTPAFYICDYQPGMITCAYDSVAFKQVMEKMKSMEMDLDSEQAEQMFTMIKWSNIITLPNKPKKLEGNIKAGAKENVLIQSGNLFEIYKNPKDYTYKVIY